MRAARAARAAGRGRRFLRAVVQAWQTEVYAGRPRGRARAGALCDAFDRTCRRRRSRPPPRGNHGAGRRASAGPAALVAALLAAARWFARHDEWVDEQVRTARRGDGARPSPSAEAAGPPLGATRRDGRQPGAPAAARRDAGAQLVALEPVPGTRGALRRWVESGGDLVVAAERWSASGETPGWVPVEGSRAPRGRAHAPATSGGGRRRRARAAAGPAFDPGAARDAPAAASTSPPAWHRVFDAPRVSRPAQPAARACAPARASWALDGPTARRCARPAPAAAASRCGTALPAQDNDALLDRDNAPLAARGRCSGTRPRDLVVADEARSPLLAFLWQRGAPAILLAGARSCSRCGAARRASARAARPRRRRGARWPSRSAAPPASSPTAAARRCTPRTARAEEAAAPRVRGFADDPRRARAPKRSRPHPALDAHAARARDEPGAERADRAARRRPSRC